MFSAPATSSLQSPQHSVPSNIFFLIIFHSGTPLLPSLPPLHFNLLLQSFSFFFCLNSHILPVFSLHLNCFSSIFPSCHPFVLFSSTVCLHLPSASLASYLVFLPHSTFFLLSFHFAFSGSLPYLSASPSFLAAFSARFASTQLSDTKIPSSYRGKHFISCLSHR